MTSGVESSVTVAATEAASLKPVGPRRGRPRRQYKCAFCAKTFKRSEHCIRHERTHTQEKPFVCGYCGKSYSRKDLVTRHEKTLHAQAHQRRIQHVEPDNIADEVNVANASIAQPRALRTPPGDEPESSQHIDIDDRRLHSGEAVLPETEIRCSDSPSSSLSSSSDVAASSGRRTSSNESALRYTRNSSFPVAMATTLEPTAHPSAARTTVAEAHSHDFPPLSPHAGENSMTGLMDTDVMRVLDDALMSEVNGGMDITRQSLSQPVTLETSAPMDQDHASFYFSPMLNFDIDHSAFAFMPLPDQSAIQDSGTQSYFQPHGDLRPQQLPIEESGIYSTADNPVSESQPLAGIGALGQFMDDRSTPKSQASSNSLPALHEDRQIYTPAALDEFAYQSILRDLSIRLTKTVESIQLPPARVCQSFLSSYTTNFHCHLPLIHLHSFSPRATPSPLILAMCSVGALYRLDRRRANQLHELAVSAIETVACPTRDSESIMVKNTHLWHAQTKLLLSFYAIMSGDKDLLSGTLRLNGYYVLLYKRTRTALASSSVDVSRLTWHQWIERESWKRLLGGLFFTSALTMVLFDVNPGFNATQDLEFEAFHDEAMWDASSANEWRQVRMASIKKHPAQHHRTMKEVLVDVMLEGRYHSDTAPYQVSAFSALILMHGVVVHMWQRLQVTHAIWSLDGPDLLGSSLMDSSMAILSRCDAFLKRAGSLTQDLDSDEDDETSLVFNCQAVLRIAYISLFRTVNPSAHISLMSTDAAETDDAIASFVAGELDRSPQILNAVVKCFEGLRIPVKMGTMLVRKTAAFRWSVEHAISGWECALVVTKWVHAVEMMSSNGAQLSPEEQKLLTLVREVLEEAECDLEQVSSLAAGVARTWGSFLQDVWIWGITPQMGATLGLLANAYEKANKGNRRSSVTGPNHLW